MRTILDFGGQKLGRQKKFSYLYINIWRWPGGPGFKGGELRFDTYF